MVKIISKDDHKFVKEIDCNVKNKFRWAWLETCVSINTDGSTTEKVPLSNFIRKVDVAGKAQCIICDDLINYANSGSKALVKHTESKKHMQQVMLRKTNTTLPGASSKRKSGTSGFFPMFKEHATSEETVKPLVAFSDRVCNAEAMLLGVLAENSLPLTMAPVLVKFAKEMTRDGKVLNHLNMDRTTASYKMQFGMAESFKQATLSHLRQQPFSLNIDESTSTNLQRVLCILVSYFSEEAGQVVIEHMTSLSVTKVDAKSLFNEITALFESNNIPWRNLVSILMDSCNVMRGSKSGLEVRIRTEKAKHLLDIDGDTCHHVHNATKVFCKPFSNYLEHLYTDIATDFKWSADLRDYLANICELLGLKFTMPERYVSHRWLSMYDVSLNTSRLFDAYIVFYYGFISNDSKSLYEIYVQDVYKSHETSSQAVEAIAGIQSQLAKKQLTNDGKNRKDRIVTKLFYQKKKTELVINFYLAVLPSLKNYVCLFESRRPMVHKLLDKQEDLFREFLAFFVKPQFIGDRGTVALKNIDLNSEDILVNLKDMYVGYLNDKLIQKADRKDKTIFEFRESAITAYKDCAVYLQKKLPLDSAILKAISAIDPMARGHSASLKQLKKLPLIVTNILAEGEIALYGKEVHLYSADVHLPPCVVDGGTEIHIDKWWHQVSTMGKYPNLCKMVKGLLTCFHGPQVEGTFSSMGNILNDKACRMNITTYSSIQTVRYALRAKEKDAMSFFHRKDILHDKVPGDLCYNLRSAFKKYKTVLEEKQEELKLKEEKKQSKKSAKALNELANKKAKLAHQTKRKARLAALTQLAAKRRKLSENCKNNL